MWQYRVPFINLSCVWYVFIVTLREHRNTTAWLRISLLHFLIPCRGDCHIECHGYTCNPWVTVTEVKRHSHIWCVGTGLLPSWQLSVAKVYWIHCIVCAGYTEHLLAHVTSTDQRDDLWIKVWKSGCCVCPGLVYNSLRFCPGDCIRKLTVTYRRKLNYGCFLY
jgi:hypothetical protein